MELDEQGKRLLKLLDDQLRYFKRRDPRIFIGYKACHERLGLEQKGTTWGRSLQRQGLNNLGDWTKANNLPAVTGLIVNEGDATPTPSESYFTLFDKSPDDYEWWLQQIDLSMNISWKSYYMDAAAMEPCDKDVPERIETKIQRIIRDTALSKKVKALHNYKCQLCGTTIELPDGQRYAEAHHIKPLGSPHDGPDIMGNLICLCPNHHAMLDYGALRLELSSIRKVAGHEIAFEYLAYHNNTIFSAE